MHLHRVNGAAQYRRRFRLLFLHVPIADLQVKAAAVCHFGRALKPCWQLWLRQFYLQVISKSISSEELTIKMRWFARVMFVATFAHCSLIWGFFCKRIVLEATLGKNLITRGIELSSNMQPHSKCFPSPLLLHLPQFVHHISYFLCRYTGPSFKLVNVSMLHAKLL